MRLGQLLQDTVPRSLLGAAAELSVTGITLDSRQVSPGSCFIAVPGHAADGRDFIEAANASGAAAILVEAEEVACQWRDHIPSVSIPNLATRVSHLAGNFYANPAQKMHLLAVTGTNGKTTCTHLYAQLATALGALCGLVGTNGCGVHGKPMTESALTTPDAISMQRILADFAYQSVDAVALEASSHSLDQHRIAALPIATGVFTNLSRDHLDYHETMERYAQAKWQLFDQYPLARAVINLDDSWGERWSRDYRGKGKLVTYSIGNASADFWAENILYRHDGCEFLLNYAGQQLVVSSPLVGEFNVRNLLAVIAAFVAEGQDIMNVISAIKTIHPVAGRMEFLPSKLSAPTVVVDYAHTPDSLIQSLKAARLHCQGLLWCVFGCGGNRDRGKRSEMAKAAETYADRVVVTDDNPRFEDSKAIAEDIALGFSGKTQVQTLLDRAQAIDYAVSNAGQNDLVLIAGKGHETYQLVGDQTLPFSDALVGREALTRWEQANA